MTKENAMKRIKDIDNEIDILFKNYLSILDDSSPDSIDAYKKLLSSLDCEIRNIAERVSVYNAERELLINQILKE